ncbi:MAG: purine-nucleoside phosphorylase [Deltaproteobacteria bacterium]|nr:purine-nucleoside phosphorylase [Deltaproteobacteria bacterium]
MPTPHLAAKPGDIADIVLLPGDPLRAKLIAERFFESPTLYNEVRGMLGYTGTYKGRRVSVQGSGMGVPSISIYAHELITEYGARTLIRVGICGSMQPHVGIRDLVLGQSASTDSSTVARRFPGMTFAPTADFHLLHRAWQSANERGFKVHVGNVLSTDTFYDVDQPDGWKTWASHNVLAAEMEAAGLYTIASRFGARALAVLMVSDSLVTHESLSAAERQTGFADMVHAALDAAIE